MSLNIPSYNEQNFSFGPGILRMGPAGATPTADVGAITEDGITITPENTTRDITQGNPRMPVYTFSQAQGATVEATGIEWNFVNLAFALGAGVTSVDVGEDVLSFGGEPIVQRVGLHIEHQMAVTGNTLHAYIWKAVTNGAPALALGQDEHQFPMAFKAHRSATDWAGNPLARGAQLMKLVRVKQ